MQYSLHHAASTPQVPSKRETTTMYEWLSLSSQLSMREALIFSCFFQIVFFVFVVDDDLSSLLWRKWMQTLLDSFESDSCHIALLGATSTSSPSGCCCSCLGCPPAPPLCFRALLVKSSISILFCVGCIYLLWHWYWYGYWQWQLQILDLLWHEEQKGNEYIGGNS